MLEQDDGNGTWASLGTKTVTYDATNADFNKFDFSDIVHILEFDKVGSYSLRVSEAIGSLENVDYDKTVNYFTVKVGDRDMDGNLEIEDVTATQNIAVDKNETTGEYVISVTFNNTFVPPSLPMPQDINVSVTVNKTVVNEDTTSIGPENFEFVLENIVNSQKTALKSDTEGLAIFNLTFAADDIGETFNYRLTETNDQRQGLTYSTEVYDIKVEIALGEDNKLEAIVTLNGTVTENCVAKFENKYHSETTIAPPAGESNNLTFWFEMLIISMITLVVLLIAEKRDRRKNMYKSTK